MSAIKYIEKVAIVGAGGWLGKHITAALLAGGKHSVTALTRADSNHQIPAGVAKAVVDYEKPDTIVDALRGQDFLVITLGVRAPPTTSGILLRAAAAAGVRYVMPNLHGPSARSRPLMVAMGFGAVYDSSIALCRELGLQAVVVSPGFWYEYSLAGGVERYGFDLEKRVFVVFDNGNAPIHTSTWPHSGAAVAAVLSLPVDADPATTKPTLASFALPNAAPVASFTVTQNDMFASIKRVTGTTDADWTIIRGQTAKARWEAACAALASAGAGGSGSTNVDGTPLSPFAAFVQKMYAPVFFDGGDGLAEADLVDDVLGLPKDDLDKWTAVAVDYVKNKTLSAYGQ